MSKLTTKASDVDAIMRNANVLIRINVSYLLWLLPEWVESMLEDDLFC